MVGPLPGPCVCGSFNAPGCLFNLIGSKLIFWLNQTNLNPEYNRKATVTKKKKKSGMKAFKNLTGRIVDNSFCFMTLYQLEESSLVARD
jgi:hypothetical protein